MIPKHEINKYVHDDLKNLHWEQITGNIYSLLINAYTAGYNRANKADVAENATSDRPQGDLISRAWLKKHKFTTQVCNGLEIEDVDVVGVATIDNAPTVDAYTEDDVKTAIKEGHQVGYEMAKAKYERPTGEWIEDVIEELESRKDYGEEYAQAIEDVIVILNAKFGGRE